jgi:hypothetical protein
MRSLHSLPRPDQFGNYWFGSPRHKGDTGAWDSTAPAILHLPTYQKGRKVWVVSLGEGGMLWSRGRLKSFDSPEAALRELRRHLP